MDQKERIEDLMKKKGIETYQNLLIQMLKVIGKEEITLDLIERKKGNFSKMISGEREFTVDYVLALEKIFNVSYLYIKEGKKKNVNDFNNTGFRYTCYLNDYDAFVKLGNEIDYTANHILKKYDEYNKHLLDYIIEYDAVEGLRYLSDKHKLSYKSLRDCMWLDQSSEMIYATNNDYVYLISKLLIERNEIELFNKIFNPYELVHYYRDHNIIYADNRFLKLILSNAEVLDSILNYKELSLKIANPKRDELNDVNSLFINPLISFIYKFAIENYIIYENEINKILKTTLELNQKIFEYCYEKFPMLNTVKILENNFLCENNIFYALIFMPENNVKELSDETENLISQNDSLINSSISKINELYTESNEEEILKNLCRFTNIKGRYRNKRDVLLMAKKFLDIYKVSEKFRRELSYKLSDYLTKELMKLDKNNPLDQEEYENIKWALIFIEMYENELNEL